MSYQAIVCKLVNLRPHNNADRLQLATVYGSQVVIDLSKKKGDLGIFFPSDGQLLPEMLLQNNLYTNHPVTGEKMGGFFGANGRVRAQNFRGEKSEGFWTELKSVAWTGVNLSELQEGFTFTHLNGKEVCRKYISSSTRNFNQKSASKKKAKSRQRRLFQMLKEHFDTPQLRYEIGRIPKDSILYFTSKVHGTSQRTGNILEEEPCKGLRWWISEKLKIWKPKKKWQVISGTRRVVLKPEDACDTGYYSGKTFRIDIHKMFQALNIPKGYQFFYEIAGFDETLKPLMPVQGISKIGDKKLYKEVKKLYGDTMTFSYGCGSARPNRVFVYSD